MIGKVIRGGDVGGLLRYLFGPGRANEHTDPHLVGAWDDDPGALEPARNPRGWRDTRPLAQLLEQPLASAGRRPDRPVWHCPVRVAPGDRRLTDAEWREVARDLLHATGLAPRGDDGGCRWVAVRHADDHIHLVVTLARQDGRPARTSNDYFRLGEACRAAERRLGLTRTAPRDRTAAHRATRAEREKSVRAGRAEPARSTLQREVRTAAARAATPEDFIQRLTDAGLQIRLRRSDIDSARVVGYSVALPGDRTATGTPVWFGGGKLAADLSWPKLATRWRDGAAPTGRPSRQERAAVWRHAADVIATSAAQVGRLAQDDPTAAGDLAHGTGDVLSTLARTVEGRRRGPITQAADAFDRASRELHGRIPIRTEAGHSLRAVARLLSVAGRAGQDETTQVLALLTHLIALADAVAQLRQAQQRSAQAAAAGSAASRLRDAADRFAPIPTIHRPPTPAVIHSRRPAPPTHTPSRRKVQR